MARRKAAQFRNRGSIRLHLGCGFTRKAGWVNIDLLGGAVDIPWDLSRGIPFPAASVEAIFHEHMLEHVPTVAALPFTQECIRVLKPGGVLRVAVPDAGLCLRSYAGTDDPDWAVSRPLRMLAVESLFYENGHVSMWDVEKLTGLLDAAGFADAKEREFGDSRIVPCPDSEHRHGGTLYVECVKP